MLLPDIIAKAGTEAATQAALFCWASNKPELKWMLRIGNEDNKSAALGAKAKSMGLKKGVADILLPIASLGHHGLWIELKNGRNKQSKSQIEFMEAMQKVGYRYEVCYNWREAAFVIRQYLYKNNDPLWDIK
jgi:hypothetical protein